MKKLFIVLVLLTGCASTHEKEPEPIPPVPTTAAKKVKHKILDLQLRMTVKDFERRYPSMLSNIGD